MPYLRPNLPTLACLVLLLSTESLLRLAWTNALAQLVLFVGVVLLPTWRTGRMSWVDIGWPTGVAIIGAIVLAGGTGDPTRVRAVAAVYLAIGLRMSLAAIRMWRAGHLDRELPRYEYQRIRWERRGLHNVPLIMQSEALAQGTANMSFLALPAFLMATNASPAVHPLEIVGLVIWGVAIVLETVADLQKRAFLRDVKAKGLSRQVCDVGLWRYSRHPNYFAEWMVWSALVLASIPSWPSLFEREHVVVGSLLVLCTVFVVRVMYSTLVSYTGAKPAEFYSVQKRPAYREYQQRTNMFFPGPPRTGA